MPAKPTKKNLTATQKAADIEGRIKGKETKIGGMTTRMKGHARASAARSQAKKDNKADN